MAGKRTHLTGGKGEKFGENKSASLVGNKASYAIKYRDYQTEVGQRLNRTWCGCESEHADLKRGLEEKG